MARRILILLCLLPCIQLSHDSCRSGQFYRRDSHGRVSCFPCKEGTYMDQDSHTQVDCIRCSEADSGIYQVMLQKCTPDSDTVIGCKPNYFKDDNNQCKPCKDCQHDLHRPIEVRACTSDHDTVCCGRGMREELDSTGFYHCVEDTPSPAQPTQPTSEICNGSARACMRGQYLVICSSHNQRGSCHPCGDGTFMNLSVHSQTSCAVCSQPWEAGLQVQSVCNRTHNVVYRRECLALDTSSYDSNFYALIWILVFSVFLNVVLFCVLVFFLKTKAAPISYL